MVEPVISRREFTTGLLAVGGAASASEADAARGDDATRPTPQAKTDGVRQVDVELSIDGTRHRIAALDVETSLLDCLRDVLHLTGTKKGCGLGQCGACTVLVDGQRVKSCLALAVLQEGASITTVEGLCSPDGTLHPVQAAFIAEDAFQCGYCTPGQIMSAVACIREGHAGSDAEIREWMSGNLCRCGAYTAIVAAVRRAAGQGI